jgi:hypothetical protein
MVNWLGVYGKYDKHIVLYVAYSEESEKWGRLAWCPYDEYCNIMAVCHQFYVYTLAYSRFW